MFTKALVIDIFRAAIQSVDATEYCKNLLHSVVGPYGARGVALWRSNEQASLKVIGRAGYNDHLDCDQGVPLWADVPLCNAVRNNLILVRPTLSSEFAKNDARPDESDLWTINAPVKQSNMVIGGLQIYFDCEPDHELVGSGIAELLAVASECYFTETAHLRWNEQQLRSNRSEGLASASLGRELTLRQRQILQRLADGLTYFQIGQSLIISESTAKQEATRIFRKLEVANRFEAVSVARSRGIISREDAAEPQ